MACTQERSERIADLAGSRLDAQAVDELLEHLEGCAACSHELDLTADLVAGAEAPTRVAPARRRLRLLRFALPVAAAAALVLVLLGPWGRTPPSPASLARLEPLPYPEVVLRGEADDAERRAAMDLYRRGDHARAAAALAALAERDPRDALSRFYRGVSLIQVGELADARISLEAAARQAEGLLRERALWYLANAELALEDVAAARATLARLSALDGEYARRAEDLLAALERLPAR